MCIYLSLWQVELPWPSFCRLLQAIVATNRSRARYERLLEAGADGGAEGGGAVVVSRVSARDSLPPEEWGRACLDVPLGPPQRRDAN